MSVAYDIRALLASASITASVNNMPLNVTDAVAVFETGGMPPDYTHGTAPAIDDKPSFQILIHNADGSANRRRKPATSLRTTKMLST